MQKKFFSLTHILTTAVMSVIILCVSQEILANGITSITDSSGASFGNKLNFYNSKEKNDIAKLKKAYLIITDNFLNMMKEEEKTDLGETAFFKNMPAERSTDAETQVYLDEALGGLNIRKTCYNYLDDCKKIKYGGLKYPSWIKTAFPSHYRIYTNDGMLYYFDIYKNGIAQEAPEEDIIKAGGMMTKIYGLVQIDINGNEKPNVWGKDLFGYYIAQDGHLYPYYGKDRAIYNAGENWKDNDLYWRNKKILCGGKDINKSIFVSGEGCSARIMENNWKYDYEIKSIPEIFNSLKQDTVNTKQLLANFANRIHNRTN